jgi:hypothetical protein
MARMMSTFVITLATALAFAFSPSARADTTVDVPHVARLTFNLTFDLAATLQTHGDRRLFVQPNGDRLSHVLVTATRRLSLWAEAAAFVQLGFNGWNGAGLPTSTDNTPAGRKPVCTQDDGAACTVAPNGSQGLTANWESTLRVAFAPGDGPIKQYEPGDRAQLIFGRTVTLNLVNLHLFAPDSVFGLTSSLTLGDDHHSTSQYRTSNGVYLWSPKWHGLYGQVGYALGQDDWHDGQVLMARTGYDNEKWLHLAAASQYSQHPQGDVASFNLGSAFVLGPVRLTAMGQWSRVLDGPNARRDVFAMLGGLVHVGPVDLFTALARLDVLESPDNANQIALGAIWNLVTWSALYAKTTYQINEGQSALQPFGTDPVSSGEDPFAAQAGWRVSL